MTDPWYGRKRADPSMLAFANAASGLAVGLVMSRIVDRLIPRPKCRLLVRCRSDRKVPPLVICSAHAIRERWLMSQEVAKLHQEVARLRTTLKQIQETAK